MLRSVRDLIRNRRGRASESQPSGPMPTKLGSEHQKALAWLGTHGSLVFFSPSYWSYPGVSVHYGCGATEVPNDYVDHLTITKLEKHGLIRFADGTTSRVVVAVGPTDEV